MEYLVGVLPLHSPTSASTTSAACICENYAAHAKSSKHLKHITSTAQ